MPGSVSRWQRCPFCGAGLSEPLGALGWQGPTCPDCGRVANVPAHPYYGLYGAVEYDFDDVTPAERAEAADLLIGADVPYRWEEGYRLLVDPKREDQVDALFGHDTADDAEATDDADTEHTGDTDESLVGPDDVDEPDVDETAFDETDFDEGAPDDERGVEALGRLFDASDRLRHRPADEGAAAELADAAGVVLIAPVPFGLNRVLWNTAGVLARQLVDLLEHDADPDDVIAGADALRALLRDHV